MYGEGLGDGIYVMPSRVGKVIAGTVLCKAAEYHAMATVMRVAAHDSAQNLMDLLS